MIKYYVLFPNHLNGLKLNEILKNEKIENTIAPTPRKLSSCCGMSLLVREEDIPDIERIISRDMVEILKIASVEY